MTGRHRRLPKWLRLIGTGARKCGKAAGRFARDAATDSDELLERWQRAERLLAGMKPINDRVDITLPRLLAVVPVAEVAGRPPWGARQAGAS